MSNPLIRSEDHFVLLEPNSKEKIVTKKEALLWLRNWLPKVDSSTIYQKKDYSNEEFLEELLESTYELEIKFGFVIKWFAVRVEPD
ncbi:chlororespiratory reduction protein 7 [Prochlorococcus sp. AH-716-E13]|nr:chlororespiratory reduction protein 7 [Prochlorococcus sp. AH-716-E13]